jgi:DNA (cytosine-5)-methyltransferase 1
MRKAEVVPISNLKAGESVELFSGCGGLALGLAEAGFGHRLLVEWDDDAFLTVAHNKARRLKHVKDWRLAHTDVRGINWKAYAGVQLVAGGPPCQPFSIGGKHNGHRDDRDMWPEAVRAVREIEPPVFLFENVKGLLRSAFASYVKWITLCLQHPDHERGPNETHLQHLNRLERVSELPKYDVRVFPVNAADFGVPQKRHRVVFLGIDRDLKQSLVLPAPTHSLERLVWDKWITGEYWTRHGLSCPDRSLMSIVERRIVDRLSDSLSPPTTLPWVTCRDAFVGLGEPGSRPDLANHQYQPGARSYAGHTGSPFDEPAKALKAGVHGVPGGENMLARDDGSVRYFSVREAARLQGLPDTFEFTCSWSESMRQLGNAVPVQLASVLGRALKYALSGSSSSRRVA